MNICNISHFGSDRVAINLLIIFTLFFYSFSSPIRQRSVFTDIKVGFQPILLVFFFSLLYVYRPVFSVINLSSTSLLLYFLPFLSPRYHLQVYRITTRPLPTTTHVDPTLSSSPLLVFPLIFLQ